MDRTELLAVVDDSWRQLDAAVAGLDEAALDEPGVVEAWSIKDVLGHVAAWEQVALGHIERWQRGEPPARGEGFSVDGYNAREAARRGAWSLAQIQAEATETRQRLRATLESLSDAAWAAPFGEGDDARPLGAWVGGALGGAIQGAHAVEHAEHIRIWRDARERRMVEQLATLVATRSTLLQAIDGASEAELSAADSGDGWPARVVLAHIAAWNRRMIDCIVAWLDGAAPPEPVADADAFNADIVAQERGNPLAATLIALAREHDDFLAVVARAHGRDGELQYTRGARGPLSEAIERMTAHERAHAGQILAHRRGRDIPATGDWETC